MLTTSCVGIVATDTHEYLIYERTTFVKTIIAIANKKDNVDKWYFDIAVPNEKLSEFKLKLTKGTVCSMKNISSNFINNKPGSSYPEPKYNRSIFTVNSYDIKFFGTPKYNQDIADKLVFETKGETDVT